MWLKRNWPSGPSGACLCLPQTPSIHYTMGGLRISAQAEVLEEVGVDSKGLYRKLRPIRGLFAAGEVRTEQPVFCL